MFCDSDATVHSTSYSIVQLSSQTVSTMIKSCFAALVVMGNCMPTSVIALSAPARANKNYRLYDMVVIGGGSAGLTAAKLAATFGKSVVIVEQERMGGDCTWSGCVPSKSIIASAEVAHTARNANKYGIKIDPDHVQVDMKAVKDRVRANIEKIYKEDDSPDAMKKLGIDTIIGKAIFSSSNTLTVSTSSLSANTESKDSTVVEAKEGIVVATGAKARRPTGTISGLANINYITYEEVFDLDYVPSKMTVVGGGPIGCELAQTFSRLGSEVTQIANKLVSNEDEDAGKVLEEVFEAEGIKLVRGAVTGVEVDGTEGHRATCQCTDGTTTSVQGDLLLVAVGRVPNVKGMGLESLGAEFSSNGGIQVNKKLQVVGVNNVYAAGDCTGDKQFTHYAGFQGAIAARNILLPLTDPGQMDVVPATTFTSPEIGSVGLTDKEAIAEYGEDKVVVVKQELHEVDRAVCAGDEKGFLKVVFLKKNYKILGATIVSPAAGELISEISVAMKANMGFDKLATVMHAYPAYSFALQVMAADIYYQKTLKSKGILSFLKKLGL